MSLSLRLRFRFRNYCWDQFFAAPAGSLRESFWIRLHAKL